MESFEGEVMIAGTIGGHGDDQFTLCWVIIIMLHVSVITSCQCIWQTAACYAISVAMTHDGSLHLPLHVLVYTHTCTCAHTHTCTCIHTQHIPYTYIHIYTHTYTDTHTHIHGDTHTHTHTLTHTDTHTQTFKAIATRCKTFTSLQQ